MKTQKSFKSFVSYIQRFIGIQGGKLGYACLLMYYAFKNKSTPSWAKNIIIGCIGYVLSPIDSIPDLTPIIGVTDDLGVLGFGLSTIACYIDEEVRTKSRLKLKNITGQEPEEKELLKVDSWL